MRRTSLVVFAIALLTAACGGDDATTDGPPDPATPSPSPSEELADIVETGRKLVVQHTGADAGEVQLIESREVTWRDGALGCPQPGQVYTQALVEGYQLVFEVDGEQVFVHGRQGGEPFVCEDPEERGGNTG